MTETKKPKATAINADPFAESTTGSLVFISHDARDAELAEAFGKLLKSASSGMIKTFRSTDKKGTEGIDFGGEWYTRLMDQLQATSDVVCLFTERSLDRPWILFEAGVAKGRLNIPVLGLALGIPLSRVSTGPFYQFQNSDDTDENLTKLLQQLAKRIPNLELDPEVVKTQIEVFRKAEDQFLKTMKTVKKETGKTETENVPIARLVEEMKSMPLRVAEYILKNNEPLKRQKFRNIHPMRIEEMLFSGGDFNDPVGILMAASLIKDDMPWLYELAMEVYRAVKSGDRQRIESEMSRLRRFSETIMRGPIMEDILNTGGKEAFFFCKEFPRMLEHVLHRSLKESRTAVRAHNPEKE
jgi:hypothetical protein